MTDFEKFKNILCDLDLPIYISGHIRPDQDSICSSLALMEYLKSKNKDVHTLLRQNDMGEINWLNDNSGIISEVTDSNYALVMLDMNDSARLGDYKPYFERAKITINIDHHEENKFEADYTLSMPDMSSTCEMIYNIIKADVDYKFSKKVVDLIYSGMFNDSHSFSRRITESTLSDAQELINLGADYKNIIKWTFSNRTMYQMRALSKIIENIKFDGIHYVTVDMSKPEFCDLTYNQLVKQIAEDIRVIEDIKIFIMMIKYTDKTVCKVTSALDVNADQIARVFGGGGHKKEAGFTVTDMDEKQIVNKAKEFLGDILAN